MHVKCQRHPRASHLTTYEYLVRPQMAIMPCMCVFRTSQDLRKSGISYGGQILPNLVVGRQFATLLLTPSAE